MKPKTPSQQRQYNFLYQDLLEQLNPKDPLLLLAKQIPWEMFEKEFSVLYADRGRPGKPIRLMVGLLLLKHVENLSDERVVEAWVRNPYYQAFCGVEHFQWRFPCDPSELVHFRKRIGASGVEKIFNASVTLHGAQALEQEVVIDTTVQEKNITFPTDTKLRLKVIDRCRELASEENIALRRSYRYELKKLRRVIRFSKGKKTRQRLQRPSVASEPSPMRCSVISSASCLKTGSRPCMKNLRFTTRLSIRNVMIQTRFTAFMSLMFAVFAKARNTKNMNLATKYPLP